MTGSISYTPAKLTCFVARSADHAATGFAKHARAAAITAATAANGALKGERAAMVGGLKAIASAHSAQAGAQAAMEYAKAAQSAVHPFIDGGFPRVIPAQPEFGDVSEAGPAAAGSTGGGEQPAADVAEAPEADGESAVMGAKELVESVVTLMQQLTNALQSADNCEKVQEILTYYSATMAKFQQEGQDLAPKLSVSDMNLIQQYAQSQVASFANNLEEVSAFLFWGASRVLGNVWLLEYSGMWEYSGMCSFSSTRECVSTREFVASRVASRVLGNVWNFFQVARLFLSSRLNSDSVTSFSGHNCDWSMLTHVYVYLCLFVCVVACYRW